MIMGRIRRKVLFWAAAGTLIPATALAYTYSTQVTLAYAQDVNINANTGTLVIGNSSGKQIAIDDNEIMARGASGATATLSVQAEGGAFAAGPTAKQMLYEGNNLKFSTTWLNVFLDDETAMVVHRPDSSSMHMTLQTDVINVWGRIAYQGVVSVGGSATLCISGYSVGTCSSSARFKNNVETLPAGLAKVMAMRPVTFDWKEGGAHDYGFIAEEAAKVLPELVNRDPQGRVQGFGYQPYTAVLTRAVQEQQATIEGLQASLGSERKRVQEQQLELDRQREELTAARRELATLVHRL
jgi:hypothetical protein